MEHMDPTSVLFTIDVEDPYYPGEMHRIWGEFGDRKFGVPMIMDVLEEYGFNGVFFVDIYERALHSDDKMKHLIQVIANRGHEIQLHTHPGTDLQRYGKGGMAHRSVDDQVKIIKDGAEFIEKCIGYRPLAHRAGGYKADDNTLEALRRAGFKYDASLFPKNPNCLISMGDSLINDIGFLGGIIEVPVTTLDVSIGPFRRLMKLDIEQDICILLSGLEAAVRKGLTTVTVFLHSWSFVETYRQTGSPRMKNIAKFRTLCDFIASKSDEFAVRGFQDLPDLGEGASGAVYRYPSVTISPFVVPRILWDKSKVRVEYTLNRRRIDSTKSAYDF